MGGTAEAKVMGQGARVNQVIAKLEAQGLLSERAVARALHISRRQAKYLLQTYNSLPDHDEGAAPSQQSHSPGESDLDENVGYVLHPALRHMTPEELRAEVKRRRHMYAPESNEHG